MKIIKTKISPQIEKEKKMKIIKTKISPQIEKEKKVWTTMYC
jgi:hypothetical protein